MVQVQSYRKFNKNILVVLVILTAHLSLVHGNEEKVVVECFDCPHQDNFDIDLVDINRAEEYLCLNQAIHACEQPHCIQTNETNLRKFTDIFILFLHLHLRIY